MKDDNAQMVADAAEVKAGNGIFAPFDGTPKAGAGQRLSYGNPRKSAEEFVFLLAGLSHQRALIRWRGDWYRWTGTYWRTVAEETLTMWLWEFLSRSQIAVATKGEETTKYTAEPFKPTKTRVGEVRSALAGLSSVLVPSAIEAPSWQEDGAGAHNLAHEYVALANGLLHLPTRKLLLHTPDFFNLNALGFAYDADARAPEWQKFLGSVWPDDVDSIDTLGTIFGYLVGGRAEHEKIFFLKGPRRSGKGTIFKIVRALLGTANVTSPSLTALGERFGLESLIGKSLCLISDARQDFTKSRAALTERLLNISGNDHINIERKNRTDWRGQVKARFLMGSNLVPRLGDKADVIASRFLPLNMTISFYGREDLGLIGKLLPELPGIFNWSLDGLARLDALGRFVVPQSAQHIVERLSSVSSYHATFVEDRGYALGKDTESVLTDEIFADWCVWCAENRVQTGTKISFVADLEALYYTVRERRPRGAGRRPRRLYGIMKPADVKAQEADRVGLRVVS